MENKLTLDDYKRAIERYLNYGFEDIAMKYVYDNATETNFNSLINNFDLSLEFLNNLNSKVDELEKAHQSYKIWNPQGLDLKEYIQWYKQTFNNNSIDSIINRLKQKAIEYMKQDMKPMKRHQDDDEFDPNNRKKLVPKDENSEIEDEPQIDIESIDYRNVKFEPNPEDLFNELVQDNTEYLKQIPELTQEATFEFNPEAHKKDIATFKFDIHNPKKNIFFKKHGNLWNLKDDIKKCIDNNTKDNLVVKIWFKNPFDKKVEFRTITLANEEGMDKMRKLLNMDEVFKLEDKWNEGNFIAVSGDNGVIEWQILAKDILGIQIYDKRFLDNFGRVYKDNGGKFYKYKINKRYEGNNELIQKLARYQIFESLENHKQEFEYNCLIYALKMTNLGFGQFQMESLKDLCYDRYVSMKDVDKLGKVANIRFNIVKKMKNGKYDDITKGKKIIGSDKQDAKLIKLALIDEHYILNEEVQGINKLYLKNYEEINKECSNKPIEWRMKLYKKYMINEKQAHMKSYEFVEMMTSDKIEWNFEELKALPSNIWNVSNSEIKDLKAYSDCDFISFNEEEKKKEKKIEHSFYYADTETDVSGEYHKAFCISYTLRGSNEIKTLIGENCLTKFMDILPNNAVVYFHNLGYDTKMFSDFIITQSIDKGTRTMSQNFKYKGKNIIFKDSLSILSMKLSRFPQTFNLECGEKEMFPYKYYTHERLKSGWGLVEEAGKEEINWNQEQFIKNIEKLGLRYCDYFDMYGYVKFYCEQDVRILAAGFDKFRNMCLEALQIDIDEVLTAPSLANKYFERELYKKIDNFYKYSGIIRAFIQKAIYGGRCMTRDNQKWKVEHCELCDFDAVSLYPSAMARLYCQTGKCTVLNENELDLKYLLEHTTSEGCQPDKEKYISSYVVEIEIMKVNKHLHFPLIVVKDKKTGINRNTNEAKGVKMVVDNITLEDFVKFQNVECKILRGYKWTDKKDFRIRDEILKLHNLRCEYKKTKNPLQEVIKLIMNSAYGKMIQKPIVDRNVYKQYQTYDKDKNTIYPLNNYIIKNSAKIKEITQINRNIYLCKVAKQIETFATNTLLGVQVLSMSKRIMNEVMTTAEDLDIKIYYQDTDSMHIEKARLQDLADEFKLKYNRELIGKNLGQFHNDFDEVENGYAYKSIFNGKKCYIDMLKNDNGEFGIHYRMKGVSLDCVKLKANGDLFKLYDDLFNEKSIKFNLLATAPRFKSTKDRKISNQDKFERNIKFIGVKNYV